MSLIEFLLIILNLATTGLSLEIISICYYKFKKPEKKEEEETK